MIDVDTSTWDDLRVQTEIAAILPSGWKFEFGSVNNAYWQVLILDETGKLLWEDTFPAPNVVLRNAFGWLSLRNAKPKASVWARRRQVTVEEVNAEALRRARAGVPDPEDVDPVEIDKVVSVKR